MSNEEQQKDVQSEFKQIKIEDAAVNLSVDKDDRAEKETSQLSRGQSIDELRKEAERSEHGRNEHFKKHFGRITVFALYILALGVLIFGVTWFWHLLMPPNLHWLDAAQLLKIQNMFTGGVLAGAVAEQFRRKMK